MVVFSSSGSELLRCSGFQGFNFSASHVLGLVLLLVLVLVLVLLWLRYWF